MPDFLQTAYGKVVDHGKDLYGFCTIGFPANFKKGSRDDYDEEEECKMRLSCAKTIEQGRNPKGPTRQAGGFRLMRSDEQSQILAVYGYVPEPRGSFALQTHYVFLPDEKFAELDFDFFPIYKEIIEKNLHKKEYKRVEILPNMVIEKNQDEEIFLGDLQFDSEKNKENIIKGFLMATIYGKGVSAGDIEISTGQDMIKARIFAGLRNAFPNEVKKELTVNYTKNDYVRAAYMNFGDEIFLNMRKGEKEEKPPHVQFNNGNVFNMPEDFKSHYVELMVKCIMDKNKQGAKELKKSELGRDTTTYFLERKKTFDFKREQRIKEEERIYKEEREAAEQQRLNEKEEQRENNSRGFLRKLFR